MTPPARVGSGWAAILAPQAETLLGELRLRADLSWTRSDDQLWLRGAGDPDQVPAGPLRDRFVLGCDDALCRPGERVPRGRLPQGPWRALRELLEPTAQPVRPAGRTRRIPLQLERGGEQQPAELLHCPLQAAAAWIQHAPALRLDALHYALDAVGGLLLRGRPLPPLPGQRYALHGAIAVPLGWHWQPALQATVLARWLGLGSGEIALGATSGWSVVAAAAWRPLDRAELRALLRSEVADGD
jgi:hypothetical protein